MRGQPPIPPAQLALATIVQAYTGASDDEVIEATTMDRRWLTEVVAQADASVLGGSILKAALDRDWDDPSERAEALGVVLATLTNVERWLETKPEGSEDPH